MTSNPGKNPRRAHVSRELPSQTKAGRNQRPRKRTTRARHRLEAIREERWQVGLKLAKLQTPYDCLCLEEFLHADGY
jgi:hypothetical protein